MDCNTYIHVHIILNYIFVVGAAKHQHVPVIENEEQSAPSEHNNRVALPDFL